MLCLGVSVMAVLTALFTLWDPMSLEHTLSVIRRVGFSAFVASSDLVICYSCGVLVLYLSRFRSKYQTLALLAATALAVAAPCAAILYAGYTLFHGGRPPADGIMELYAVNAINLGWTTVLTFYVLLLRIGRRNSSAFTDSTAPDQAPVDKQSSADAHQRDGDAHSDNAHDDKRPRERVHIRPVAAKRLLASLPETVGQDVVYIHVSRHYLEVVTTRGSVVVLMRLADAIVALGDRGMQIHRSYWVAYRHIRDLKRRDDRMLLCLSDGYELPVSRPFLPSVRNFIARLAVSATQKHARPPD